MDIFLDYLQCPESRSGGRPESAASPSRRPGRKVKGEVVRSRLIRQMIAKLKPARIRLVTAMAAYAVLALVAVFSLDGPVRIALLIFFGFLALKTLRHSEDSPMSSKRDLPSE